MCPEVTAGEEVHITAARLCEFEPGAEVSKTTVSMRAESVSYQQCPQCGDFQKVVRHMFLCSVVPLRCGGVA